MGADFYDKAAKGFKKSFDRARATLATPDLFTRQPECVTRSVAADMIVPVTVGERLTIEREGAELIGLRGNKEVIRIKDPTSDQLEAITASCGVAQGVVEQVHELAQVAELSLC
jgi:hypothetical protein